MSALTESSNPTKSCFKCGEVKSLSAFYRHSGMSDGHLNKCKECAKLDVKTNRTKNSEYYKTYDNKRYRENPKRKEYNDHYRTTESGKKTQSRGKRKWAKNNPEKRAAHVSLNNAVRDGKIVKPSKCSQCFQEKDRIEGHHEDYSKPLEVVWLCPQCHAKEHYNETVLL